MTPRSRKLALAGVVALGLAALVAVFLLRSSRAGRPIETTLGPLHLSARFAPDPPRPGENTVRLTLTDAEGAPIEGATIQAEATMPPMGTMAEMKAAATASELGEGRYSLALELSMAGSWPLSLLVHAPDAEEARVEFDYKTGIPVRLASSSAPAGHLEGEISHYTCSMHPSVRSTTPGTCPICSMDLVPVTHGELESGTIRLDAMQRQLIGVKTDTVERKAATLSVRAVGRVVYDETQLTDITLKFQGWVGKVLADTTGAPVEKGKALFTVYAPELLSAQEEFLESTRRSKSDRRTSNPLLASARRRLLLWNMSEAQVSELARTGRPSTYVPIRSPVSGIVIAKHVVDGSAVAPGERLYRIADLARVWVEAELYEADVSLVNVGDTATVTLSYLPDRTFSGTVDYVYPYLDAPTRTGRLRLIVPNPDGALKPDMYADVELSAALGEQLLVPEDAVIRAGKTNLVFIDLGEGQLKPQTVQLGRRTPDGYVVLSGLALGDTVVTSGQFLIAAESKLKTGVEKW